MSNIITPKQKVLGVDVGGVIIDRINDNTDTSFFSDNYLQTSPVPGVFDSLRKLVGSVFGDHVHVVSKCGPNTERKTLEWFFHHRFNTTVGIRPPHVHFCRERRDKDEICRRLGITHFIDDRLEVLSYLRTVETKYLFRPQQKEVTRYSAFLNEVHLIQSWQEILDREIPRR